MQHSQEGICLNCILWKVLCFWSAYSKYQVFLINLFLAMLGLCHCVGFSLVLASGASSLVVCRLLIVVGGFSCCGSWGLGKQAWQLWRGLSSCGTLARELWSLTSVVAISGLRSCGMRTQELWLLGSAVAVPGLRSCGLWAQELWFLGSGAHAQGLWARGQGLGAQQHAGNPGSRTEPVSPTSVGRFFTTEPSRYQIL